MTISPSSTSTLDQFGVLQPGAGLTGGAYLSAAPENVLWGRLPCESDLPRPPSPPVR